MNKVVIICIGRLKTGYWKDACAHYLRQLKPWRTVELIELRDSAKAPGKRLEDEAMRIKNCLRPDQWSIALTDKGNSLTSPQLASLLRNCFEIRVKNPAFIIGGPYGLDNSLISGCDCSLSLSAFTWPHELARVLLLEQLYRAESILHNSPYHH